MTELRSVKTCTYSHFCSYIPVQLSSTNFKIQKKQVNDDAKKESSENDWSHDHALEMNITTVTVLKVIANT